MLRLLAMLVLLLLAIALGYFIHLDSGYVVIYYHLWSIEMSLWVGIALLLFALLTLYIILSLLKQPRRLGHQLQSWRHHRAQNKVDHFTEQGLCYLAQGHWREAENTLIKAAKHANTTFIHYTAAAKAANQQQAYARRDNYLRTALEKTSQENELAILSCQAQLQVQAGQWEQALATVSGLLRLSPGHPQGVLLQKTVYDRLGDWQALYALLPALKKSSVLSSAQYSALEQDLTLKHFSRQLDQAHSDALGKIYKALARPYQTHSAFVSVYAQALIKQQDSLAAQKCIEKALYKHWDGQLVLLYGTLSTDNDAALLAKAEKWLGSHPQDVDLHMTLAKLALKEAFYPKAQRYLEDLVKIQPSALAYSLLGQTQEALGDAPGALVHFKSALECLNT